MTTLVARIWTGLVVILAAAAVTVTACSQGSEGDRCNPDLAAGESECHGSLTCLQPALCAEAYCCPTTADGGPATSSNPNCQTGCNGGAASICNSGQDDGGACAFACTNDPSDLTNASSQCAASGTPEGGPDAGPETGTDAGDAGHEGSTTDAGPG